MWFQLGQNLSKICIINVKTSLQLCKYCPLWVHAPHGFVLPQSTQQLGKRILHIERRSFLINTFPCASLGNIGFYGMQDPPFLGHYNQNTISTFKIVILKHKILKQSRFLNSFKNLLEILSTIWNTPISQANSIASKHPINMVVHVQCFYVPLQQFIAFNITCHRWPPPQSWFLISSVWTFRAIT